MALGNWGFLSQFLEDWLSVPYIRDFSHASKIFRENSYELSPKQKFLFHTYFDINPEAIESPLNDRPIGLLVKEVKLPSYKFDVKEYNQYNRKRLVQTKINYDPVTITLHDDTAGIMTNMWHAYYTYYYADGRKPNAGLGNVPRGNLSNLINGGPAVDLGSLGSTPLESVQQRTQYRNINPIDADWGYIGENFQTEPAPTKAPFFRKITIFGFAQHNFVAYTLINPVITDFAHDTYNYDEGNGTMKNSMTINYETVVYNEGAIDGTAPGNIATGFAEEGYYDRENSPLTPLGFNGRIWGRGGLTELPGGFINAMDSGQLKDAYIALQAGKNFNLKQGFQLELNDLLADALRNLEPNARRRAPTSPTTIIIPTIGSTPNYLGTAGTPTPGLNDAGTITAETTAGSQLPNSK